MELYEENGGRDEKKNLAVLMMGLEGKQGGVTGEWRSEGLMAEERSKKGDKRRYWEICDDVER